MKIVAVVPALLVLVSLCGSPVPPPPGSVSGLVFFDTNLNGIRDACDRPLAGAEVAVLDSKGLTETATTGPTGEFTAANVAAGAATVSLSPPGGDVWPSTTIPDGASGVAVTVRSEDNAGGVEIGAGSPHALTRSGVDVIGVVFSDANANGKVDQDECGIPQSRVEHMEQSPEVDPYQPVSGQLNAPDPNGAFLFQDLDSVPHLSLNVVLGNWIPTGSEGDPCGGWPGVVPAVQRADGVYVATIGLQTAPRDGVISGRVFDDANSNGIRDDGEEGVTGLEVDAEAVDNHCFFDAPAALVDSDGTYYMPGLGSVEYRLYVRRPPDEQPENQLIDQMTVAPPVVDLSSGSATVDVPVHVTEAALVHIRVFNDTNNNGVQDTSEGETNARICLFPTTGPYAGGGGNGAVLNGYQGCTATGIAADPAVGPLRDGQYAIQVTTDTGPAPITAPDYVNIAGPGDVTVDIGIGVAADLPSKSPH